MSITRAQVEKELVRRAKNRMAFVNMQTTSDGTNDDLSSPIATALLEMDIAPADVSEPADADFATVTGIIELFSRAELRLLENILGNLDAVDLSVDGRSESYGQMHTSIQKRIDQLKTTIDANYGASGNELSSGLITQNFQTKAATWLSCNAPNPD